MDLILHNGNLYTMDEDKPKAQAVAIKDGIIKAVGRDDEILAMKGQDTEVIDLGAKTTIPGFNDSHIHLIGYAVELGRVDLNGVKSIDEIIERYKKFIKENNIAPGTMVFGRGWNENFFEGERRTPTKEDLDKASDVHPIYATRACGHVGCANSAALKHFGIDKNTPDIPGGEIYKNAQGELTGLFSETAQQAFRVAQKLDTADVEDLILRALPNLAKLGITSLHSDDFQRGATDKAVCDAYINLAKAGKLTVRINQKCRALNLEGYKEMLKMPQVDVAIAPYFKLGPVKIMSDGSLGGRTAFMKEDYHDDPGNKGIPIYTKEEFEAIVTVTHNSDRCVAIHAIGDEAIQWCMDAIKKAQAENPKPHLRHCIVHCQITDEVLIQGFKDNNIIAYIQPIFIHADWSTVANKVGSKKAATSYAFKTLKDMGVPIPFGTDCPVDPVDPFKNLHCAITRTDLFGKPEGGFNPNEALSPHEAVHSYTVDGAYTSYEENVKGKLKEGMYADITVLSKDLFTIKPEEILKTEAVMTVFDGKIIYRNL